MPRYFGNAVATLALVGLGLAADPPVADSSRVVPLALEPFEHLIGAWRSHGIVEAKKLEGWDETATWGWKFQQGRIAGMEITFKDGRYFSSATLQPLAIAEQYQVTAVTPSDKQVVYEGKLKGKNLVLVRQGDEASAPDQVTLQLLHDVRYAIVIEARKSPTIVKKIATIGATRADVRFGAAGKEEQGPKCIITGAPGTSTVSYMGRTYYVCCSGCASEFNHDPEKWLRLAQAAKAKKESSKSAEKGGEPANAKSHDAAALKSAGNPKPADPETGKKDPKSAAGKETSKEKQKDAEGASKAAAALLARAKLLEKNGKRDAAIQLYERVVKDFPKMTEGEEAARRLEALRTPSEPR